MVLCLLLEELASAMQALYAQLVHPDDLEYTYLLEQSSGAICLVALTRLMS